MYNRLIKSRGGSVIPPITPWQQAVFTVVTLRVSGKLRGEPQAYLKKGARMYKGFNNTFASATMPIRIVVGARESMLLWRKLVEILNAAPRFLLENR